MSEQTYEDRIKDIYVMLDAKVPLNHLTNVCMDKKVSEFNELEDMILTLHETQNDEGKQVMVNELLAM